MQKPSTSAVVGRARSGLVLMKKKLESYAFMIAVLAASVVVSGITSPTHADERQNRRNYFHRN